MVKADVRRDYYADLGLTPSADIDEIKKQFRKLALKYHPDRNPGREAEFNAKFQAIQAAHEVLIDSQLRLKYDTDRLRAGYGKLYGPSKSNPTRKPTTPKPTTQGYPPPPTARAQAPKPGFPPRASYQAHPSAGAQRYASYARAAPQQQWEKTHEESQTRADAFRGFQEMKANAMPGWANFDPRTGKSPYQAARGTPNGMPAAGQSTRPKSAYEYFNTPPRPGTSRTQSTKKKQGFAPGTAGGDEPPAANTSAYSSVPRADRSQAFNSFFGPAPSPTAKKKPTPQPSPRIQPEDNFTIPGFERLSTRYATSGGERTYFSSAGLDRSTSVRDSPHSPRSRSRTNPPSPSPPQPGRHRSASPKLKADRNRAFSSSTSSSDLDEDGQHSFKPKAVPKSRLRPNQKFSDFYQEDWIPGPGEHLSAWPPFYGSPHPLRSRRRFDGPRPQSYHEYMDQGTNDYYQGHDSDGAAFPSGSYQMFTTADPFTARRPGPQENYAAGDTGGSKDPFNMYSAPPASSTRAWSEKWGFSSPKTVRKDSRYKPPYWAYPSSVMAPATSPKRIKVASGGKSAVPTAEEILASIGRIHDSFVDPAFKSPEADPDPLYSFQGSRAPKAPMNAEFKSRSQENLYTSFSPDHWQGTFKAAAEFFAPAPSAKDPANRGRSSPGRGRTAGKPGGSSQSRHAASSQDTSRTQSASKQAPTQFAEAKFSADIWAEQLKNATWTIPQTEGTQQQANTRRTRSPKKQTRPATTKLPTAPQPPTVSTEAEEEKATLNPGSADEPAKNVPGDGEAMDIDEDIPAKMDVPPDATAGNATVEPRLVSVEPNRPEWRPNAREDQKPQTTTASSPNKAGSRPPSSGGKPNGVNTKNNLFNLKNLSNVTPLAATNNVGIDDLNDISTTLPFESRPSNPDGSRRPVRPRELDLPNPPKRPRRPAFVPGSAASQQMVLQKQAWDRYVAEMSAYMREWNTFNRRMLRHFNARQDAVETGLSPRWISAVGDSSRLNVDAEAGKESDVDNSDEDLSPGTGRGGFSAYLRGVEEDFKVRAHWDVAWERHRECILELGELRAWIRNGGKVIA